MPHTFHDPCYETDRHNSFSPNIQHQLWVRANLQATGYERALDGGKLEPFPVKEWEDEDKKNRWDFDYERRIFDEVAVSADGSNKHRLAWVRGPELDLAAGDHTIRFSDRKFNFSGLVGKIKSPENAGLAK